jgi:hypothetical protein
MTKTTTVPAAKPADRSISIGIKFIALNIGKREIRLSTEEAMQLRNELDSLLRVNLPSPSPSGMISATCSNTAQYIPHPVQEV